jgi:restriction endonuclease S subunit
MDDFEQELNRLELTEEIKIKLREEQTKLVKIIKAFERLNESEEWKTLQELVFSKSLEAIEKQLFAESVSKEVNVNKIYKLQGEWVWARQYADSARYVQTLRKQLQGIKDKLK